MHKRHIVFLINLHQDVNIARPLAYLAAKDLEVGVKFLVSHRFLEMDVSRRWQKEISLICAETGSDADIYSNSYDVHMALQNKSGIIVAASESDLTAHAETHNAFLQAPKEFLRVTLQHGFECVGFLQNREHDKAHGKSITFAADILCGWFPVERMISMAPSQRPKLYVSGPSSVLQQLSAPTNKRLDGGLICENLHSVRLRVSGDVTASYMDIFNQFCAEKAKKRKNVTIRPHPAGQYVVRTKVDLPANVSLNNEPIYKFPLNQYMFGISPPSSILLDMVLANLPTAVWGDEAGVMDIGNYHGLTKISGLKDWLDFAETAEKRPGQILKRQRNYLDGLGMPTDKEDVRARYLRLFAGGSTAPVTVESRAERVQRQARSILCFSPEGISRSEISLQAPLKPLIDAGDLKMEVVRESMLSQAGEDAKAVLEAVFDTFRPDMVVLYDYDGAGHSAILSIAADHNCPVVYYADNIPLAKMRENDQDMAASPPGRLESARNLLANSDLVWCTDAGLKTRLRDYGFKTPMISGEISSSGDVMQLPRTGPVRKVGYSGSDSFHELDPVLPVLVNFLRKYPLIHFEFFSKVPKPEALEEFGDRVTVLEPPEDRSSLVTRLVELGWDIGLCPLGVAGNANAVPNTKWIEYTSAGIAIIATKAPPYTSSCKDNRGLVVEDEEGWLAALDCFVNDDEFRIFSVRNAQLKLEHSWSHGKFQQQILDIFRQGQEIFFKRFKPSKAKSKLQSASTIVLSEPRRILVAADSLAATQEISFRRPLSEAEADGRVILNMVADSESLRSEEQCRAMWDAFRPSVLFASRFIDVLETPLYKLARAHNIPVIFHIDDNLLKVGKQLGEAKFNFYNSAPRKAALRNAINQSDLLYVSTQILGKEIVKEGVEVPLYMGQIYCTVKPDDISPYRPAATPVIGYMGTGGHAADLEMISPAIDRLMDDFPELRFETFGTISSSVDFSRYGDRYATHKRTATYEEFLKKLSQLGWWAGLAPLEDYPFNLCKADTKWVEYSLSGIPVIASRLPVYSRACSGGSGLMAQTTDEWYNAMRSLLEKTDVSNGLVHKAQDKLRGLYTHTRLVDQILAVVDMAEEYRAGQSLKSTAAL